MIHGCTGNARARIAAWAIAVFCFDPTALLSQTLDRTASLDSISETASLQARSGGGGHLVLNVAAGPSPYDLSGTGTGFVAAGRLEWWVRSYLVVEPSVGYFRYTSQSDRSIGLLLPELGVQGSLSLGAVAPYLGAGVGYGFTVAGPGDGDPTLHAAVGLRGLLSGRWGLRAEFRLRSVDPFAGSMGDATLGVGLRL